MMIASSQNGPEEENEFWCEQYSLLAELAADERIAEAGYIEDIKMAFYHLQTND